MEQITKVNERFYYGDVLCGGPDDVYRRFRDDYNASVGRAAYRRLSRLGSRKERVHEFGFVFSGCPDDCELQLDHRLRLELMGLVCGSYCWMVDCRQFPVTLTDEEFDRCIDRFLCRGSKLFRKTGKGIGTGRKSERLNTRYR